MFVLFCILVFAVGALILQFGLSMTFEEGEPAGLIAVLIGALLIVGSFNISPDSKVTALQDELGQSRLDFRQLSDKHRAVNTELIAVKKEYQSRNIEVVQLLARNEALDGRVQFLTAEMKSYEEDIKTVDEVRKNAEHELSMCENTKSAYSDKNVQLEANLAVAEGKLTKLKSLAGVK